MCSICALRGAMIYRDEWMRVSTDGYSLKFVVVIFFASCSLHFISVYFCVYVSFIIVRWWFFNPFTRGNGNIFFVHLTIAASLVIAMWRANSIGFKWCHCCCFFTLNFPLLKCDELQPYLYTNVWSYFYNFSMFNFRLCPFGSVVKNNCVTWN